MLPLGGAFVVLFVLLLSADARLHAKRDVHARRARAAERFRGPRSLMGRAAANGVQNITFSNPKASVSTDASWSIGVDLTLA